jgi:hypothetical protein
MVKKKAGGKAKKNSNSKFRGVSGWLVLVLAIFSAVLIQMLFMIGKRVHLVSVYGIANSIGVFISLILMLIYAVLVAIGIYFILKKRKLAIKVGVAAMIQGMVFTLWFNLIGILMFYGFYPRLLINGAIAILLTLVMAVSVIVYLLNSRRVKATLTE